MSDIASHRIALREARLQTRMKERAQHWWHANCCHNCRLKLAMLLAAQRANEPPPLPTSFTPEWMN